MSSTIRTLNHAYIVAEHLDSRMNVGGTVVIAGFTITKIDSREFTVSGNGINPRNNRFVCCELGEFVIWPHRKAWNAEIKAARAAA